MPRVYGKGRYIGTCYCWNYIAGSTLRINCEDNPYTGVNTPQEIIDFGYDGVCDYICSNNSNSYWYNKKGVEVSCTDCDPVTEETKKDCYYDDSTSTPPADSNCKYNYSKEACNALENGKWNEETNCCDLSKKCWLHLENGSRSEGGTLYYQEESPCTDPANIEKYPNQKCNITNTSEDKCNGHGQPYDVEHPSSSSSTYGKFKIPDLGGGTGFGKSTNCKKILGENTGYNIVNGLIKIVRILAPIVATLIDMITLIPAITAKDEKKAKEAYC